MNIFKKLYNYRELLKTNIQKEIRGRYKNSVLGIAWSFLNPLFQLIVYSVVFGALLASGDDTYHIYIVVALIPWTFYTTTLSQSAFTIIANGNIIKKVFFPREILPISIVTSGVVNFLISTIITLIFILVSGIGFTWYVVFFPLILLIQYILLLGMSFILSAITVYFRDLEHIITVFLMAAFYGTPIVYNLDDLLSKLPVAVDVIILSNPMVYIIEAYRDILYYQQMPDLQALGIVFISSVVLLVVGYFIFKKLQKGFAEEL